MNKRGLVLTTYIIIAIVAVFIALVGLVGYNVVKQQKVAQEALCLPILSDLGIVDSRYNCYVQTEDIAVTSFAVKFEEELVGFQVVLINSAGEPESFEVRQGIELENIRQITKNYGEPLSLPEVGGQEVYVVQGFYPNVEIYPITEKDGEQLVCGLSDSKSLSGCDSEISGLLTLGLPDEEDEGTTTTTTTTGTGTSGGSGTSGGTTGGDDGGPGPNSPPNANFTATPNTGPWPLSVTFNSSGSFDPDGTIVSYDWEFGDGENGTGEVTDHIYFNVGNYTPFLTVTDDDGASHTVNKVNITVNNSVPTVNITSPLNGSIITSEDVEVSFDIAGWIVLGINEDHIHFYLDNDPIAYMFYNGNNNTVEYNFASTDNATWIDSDTIRFNNLSDGAHTIRTNLSDAFHTELENPEAQDDVTFIVAECQINADCADDNNICTFAECINFQCVTTNEPDGTSCENDLYCDGTETCQIGVCSSGTTIDCSGFDDQCNLGICNDITDSCEQQPINEGNMCDDDLFCTTGEICQGGACQGGAPTCDIGETCNETDLCEDIPGFCQTDEECDDGNACTSNTCDLVTSTCVITNEPDGASCDNGLFCTTGETCSAGICENGTPTDCSGFGDQCNIGICDETNDVCEAQPLADGTSCDDDLFCDGIDECQLGICVNVGPDVNCDDVVGCTVDSCNEVTDSCDNVPDDTLCDNGLFCDGTETCDVVLDCQTGIPQCTGPGESCNETTNSCDVCTFTNAYWNTTLATEGDVVELTVEGSNCDGLEVDFNIREDDNIGVGSWDDGDVVPITQPGTAIFNVGFATVLWTAEWTDDTDGFTSDPEYIFRSMLIDDNTIFFDSINELTVTQTGGVPSVDITSPLNNSTVITSNVSVDFNVSDWIIGGFNPLEDHIHFRLDNDPIAYMFYNGNDNVVYYGAGANPTDAATWIDSDTIRLNNLPEGNHTIRAILVNAAHTELGNPEAESVVQFVVDTSGAEEAQGPKAIARWDVVPHQDFTSNFEIGVVAFHKDGIDRVEFEYTTNSGIQIDTVTEMTLNPRTNVVEYWTTLNAVDFNDGLVIVNATAYPVNGTPRLLAGELIIVDNSIQNQNGEHSMFLNANSGGSLPIDRVRYADSINGNNAWDGTSPTFQGGIVGPKQTLIAAGQALQSSYGVVDGAYIRLLPGNYTYGPGSEAGWDNSERWLTIEPAEGVTREDVIFTTRLGGGLATPLVHVNNVITRVGFSPGGPGRELWADNVVFDTENLSIQISWGSGFDVGAYLTDTICRNTVQCPIGTLIIRNASVDTISGDAFKAFRLIVNSKADNVGEDGNPQALHPDGFQWGPGDNYIVYNTKVTRMNWGRVIISHTMGPASNIAFVNVLGVQTPSDNAPVVLWSGATNHLVFQHNTFVKVGGDTQLLFRDDNDIGVPSNFTNISMRNNVMHLLNIQNTGNDFVNDPSNIIDNNHYVNGSTYNDSNATTGGPLESLFIDPNNYDMHPSDSSPLINRAFELLTPIDANNELRGIPTAIGALRWPGEEAGGEQCSTSSPTWQNTPFSSQTEIFTVEYDATPNDTAIDAITALSLGPGSTFSNFSVLVRFNIAGNIDVRNNITYQADIELNYTVGVSYHFKLVVNVPEHTYSVYVTPQGGSEQTLATDYDFRLEQNNVTSLDNWGLWADPGSHEVCNFVISEITGNNFFDHYVENITTNPKIDQASVQDVEWDGVTRYYPTGIGSGEIPNNSSNLETLLHLDENPGAQVFLDSSGNGNGGVCSGSTCPESGILGQIDNAVSFDGQDDYIEVVPLDFNGPYTLSLWFKINEFDGDWEAIISQDDRFNGPFNWAGFWIDPSGFLNSASFGACGSSGTLSSVNLAENTWYHVAVASNGVSERAVYIDGQNIQNFSTSPCVLGAPLVLGSRHGFYDDNFNGSIDDVGFWNRQLTSGEIDTIYQDGVAGSGSSGSFVSAEIDTNSIYYVFNASWFETANGVNMEISTDNGSNWCLIENSGELGLGCLDPQVGAINFTYRINFDSFTEIDWVNFTWDSTPPSSECSDGSDNDNDNATDWQEDFSCLNDPDNDDEFFPEAECQNGEDDDGDGLTDFPEDPGCSSNQDDSEDSDGEEQINIILNVSRTSCIAPCSIFFDSTETTAMTTNKPFHELDFDWDFGDVSSGNWAPVVPGQTVVRSKNKAIGGVVAHVYETPGPYIITLDVKDVQGNQAQQTVMITIQDPDSVFSGVNTICIAADNLDWTGCPVGAQQIVESVDVVSIVNSNIASGKRILLRRGDSWTSSFSINIDTVGPGIIGAFGNCLSPNAQGICGNAPVINYNAEVAGINFPSAPNPYNWTVMDLELIGPSAGPADRGITGDGMTGALILRMNVHDFHGLFSMSATNTTMKEDLTIADSWLYDCVGGSGGQGIFATGVRRFIVLGNNVSNTLNCEHIFRSYPTRGVFSENIFAYGPVGKPIFNIRGFNGQVVNYLIVSDNYFFTNYAGVGFAQDPDTPNSRLRDIIFERNVYIHDSNFESNNSKIGVGTGAPNTTIRNNLFYVTGVESRFNVIQANHGIEVVPPPTGFSVYNNIAYKNVPPQSQSNKFSFLRLTGNLTFATNASFKGLVVKNNIHVAPVYSVNNALFIHFSTSFPPDAEIDNNIFLSLLGTNGGDTYARVEEVRLTLSEWQTIYGQDNNSMEIDPFFVDPDNGDFYLQSGSPAIDNGTEVPVFEDYDGNARPFDGDDSGIAEWDIGAYEFVGGGQQPACDILSAAWNTTSATEGDLVELNVNGSGAECDGQQVQFEVWEDDINFPPFSEDDLVNNTLAPAVFAGGVAVGTWIAEYVDEGGIDPDPEYYFFANLTLNLSEGERSSNILEVVPTPTQCNDGLDNDNDGYCDTVTGTCTDGSIPGDFSCQGDPGNDDEFFPEAECQDGVDNIDGDNWVDIGDPGCHTDGDANNPGSYDNQDNNESFVGPTECSNEQDDEAANGGTNDGLIDGYDPMCNVWNDLIETAQCQDRQDNDLNGDCDFDGALGAPGCSGQPDVGCSDPNDDIEEEITGIPLGSCGVLDQVGETYVLIQNISTSGGCFNITVDGVILDGQGYTITGDDDSGEGIFAYSVVNLEIRNINIEFFDQGIDFNLVDNSLIEDVFVIESGGNFSGYGIRIRGSQGNIIRNNILINNAGGMFLGGSSPSSRDSTDNLIIGNIASFNTDGILGSGITSGIGDDRNQFINNTINSNEDGMLLGGASNVVKGNIANSNSDSGIIIWASARSHVVTDNVANNNGRGIEVNCVGAFPEECNHTIINNQLDSNDYGIYLRAVYNSTIVNNIITSSNINGIYLSAVGSGNQNNTASFNEFRDIFIDGSGESAILLRSSLSSSNRMRSNSFSNIVVTNTNPSFYDIKFEDPYADGRGAEDINLIDTSFRRYLFEQDGVTINIINSSHGKIEFLDALIGSGEYLSEDVRVLSNLAEVNSSSILNVPSNITLYNIPVFENPAMLRNGFACPSTVCHNFTSLDGPTVKFNVTGWTNYSIGNVTTVLPACSDGEDNELIPDGWIDATDPGCWAVPNDPDSYDPQDNDETNGDTGFECSDNIDNEAANGGTNDGLIDGYDPMCNVWNDPIETAECQDGDDNDGDGFTDYPDDPNCFDANDNSESEIDLTDCGVLDQSGFYILRNDIATTGSCFFITANDVVFNGNGFTVSGDRDDIDLAIIADTLDNITIKNFNIENFGGGPLSGGVGVIDFDTITNALLLNNTINNNRGWGIYLRFSPGAKIINNTANNNWPNGDGFRLSRSHDSLVRGNVAMFNSFMGLSLGHSDGVTVINNVFNENDNVGGSFGSGIELTNSSYGYIANNELNGEQDDSGIHVGSQSWHNVIENNVIIGNIEHGINVQPAIFNVTIRGNYIASNGMQGIYIVTVTNSTIVNNTIFNNTLNGIHSHDSLYNVIENNDITGNGQSGIDFFSSTRNSYIGNNLSGNLIGLVIELTGGGKVYDNVISFNTEAGISLQRGSGFNHIMNNSISDNLGYGILMHQDAPFAGSARNIIENNTISRNSGKGISIERGIYNIIRGGVIDSSGEEAIYIFDILSKGNIFNNVTVTNTNPAFPDIRIDAPFGIPGVEGTHLIDMSLGAYDFTSATTIIFESVEGKINFTESVSGASGTSLRDDVRIENNLVSVDSANVPEFNVFARINLNNIPGFTSPEVLRDGIPCDVGICTLESYANDTAVFTVTGWTDYNIGEGGAGASPPIPPGPSEGEGGLSPSDLFERFIRIITGGERITGEVVDEDIAEKYREDDGEDGEKESELGKVIEEDLEEDNADLVRGILPDSVITGEVIGSKNGRVQKFDVVVSLMVLILLVMLLVLVVIRIRSGRKVVKKFSRRRRTFGRR